MIRNLHNLTHDIYRGKRLRNIGPAGQRRRGVVQNRRSPGYKGGRGRLRLRTATCWRRARISRAASHRVRKKLGGQAGLITASQSQLRWAHSV